MTLLVSGVLLFALVHLIPSLAPGVKAAALRRVGEGGYKGLFSLALLAGLAMIVLGWRSTTPTGIYTPPASLHALALGLIILAFLLFVVSGRKSRLRRIIRHPQLGAVVLWGAGHLLLNGDNRSLVLFSSMALWAVLEIVAINRREGVWIKDSVPPWSSELITLAVAAVTVGVVVYIHPWLSGMPVHWR